MAELSDEEKAKALFGDVDASADETSKNKDAESDKDDEANSDADDKSTEDNSSAKTDDKSEEEPDASKTSLTKPYPWLKGDTPEQWTEELKTAYGSSTEEALRQKKRADDLEAVVEEAKRIIANQGQSSDTAGTSATLDLDNHPIMQYAKTLQERDMINAWGEFTKKYPQATEADSFSKIEKASAGASQAFIALNNRQPTYQELFEETAALLRWQPADQRARKDAAIKEAVSSGAVTGTTAPTGKRSPITEEQMRVARRLFPNQTDEEISKDLVNYIAK